MITPSVRICTIGYDVMTAGANSAWNAALSGRSHGGGGYRSLTGRRGDHGRGTVKLNELLKDEIARVFGRVEYGRITFFISRDNKTLNYTVETSDKIPIPEGENFDLTKNSR